MNGFQVLRTIFRVGGHNPVSQQNFFTIGASFFDATSGPGRGIPPILHSKIFFKNVVNSYFTGHEHDVLTSRLVKLIRY